MSLRNVLERPQSLELTDNFAVWRDKINAGLSAGQDVYDAVDEEMSQFEEDITTEVESFKDVVKNTNNQIITMTILLS